MAEPKTEEEQQRSFNLRVAGGLLILGTLCFMAAVFYAFGPITGFTALGCDLLFMSFITVKS